MDAFFSHVNYWHWLIFAAVLLIIEISTGTTYFLWMSIAAAVVGVLLLTFFPLLGGEYQLVIFAVLSVLSVVVWRLYLKSHPTQSDQPKLNRRGEQYVGRTLTLQEAIVNGQGKIKIDDSTWKIEGQDCPAATRIRVVGTQGVILLVEPVT